MDMLLRGTIHHYISAHDNKGARAKEEKRGAQKMNPTGLVIVIVLIAVIYRNLNKTEDKMS